MISFDETAPRTGVVKDKVARSSFYTAMRLMPKAEREAMFAIYSFCRAVDDIADDGIGSRADRHARLEKWRSHIEKLYEGNPPPDAAFLAEPVQRYGLRKQDFLTVIDGMEMDVAQNICAPDLATLDLYCERVASAVGRLSIKIFGMEEEAGFGLAKHLGRALQLTNILRDLDEDAGMDRLYLPRELLNDAGLAATIPAKTVARPEVDQVCRGLAKIAHQHYDEAERILAARPKGRLRTPRLMRAVYCEILRRMESAGWAPPRERVRLGKGELLMIVLRHGLA